LALTALAPSPVLFLLPLSFLFLPSFVPSPFPSPILFATRGRREDYTWARLRTTRRAPRRSPRRAEARGGGRVRIRRSSRRRRRIPRELSCGCTMGEVEGCSKGHWTTTQLRSRARKYKGSCFLRGRRRRSKSPCRRRCGRVVCT